ncbi:LysE family translocator [Nisaea sediminum]|uniref:LysE family translocator n=1 Tax=Nisaea sediminum TaxID=2775867 RepID=UPI001867EC1D|nr:LysE family translocator [Nisaea sediminum]
MSTPTDLLLLFLMVFPLMFSPGPSNLLCAAAGGRFGVARSIPFVIGMDVMVFVPAFLVGTGFSSVLKRVPDAFHYIQIAGALFILFLAWKILRSSEAAEDQRLQGAAPGLFEGAMVQLLNGKGLALLLVIFSQFADPGRPSWRVALEIAAALTIFSLASHFSWLTGGAWLATRFNSPKAVRIQNLVYALLLVGVALSLAIMGVIGS